MSTVAPENEFSRLVVADPRRERSRFRIEAQPAERAALARRFGLQGIDSLDATGDLAPQAGGRWRLRATIHAKVTQSCVVSGDPVAQSIDERIDIAFAPEPGPEQAELDMGTDDAEPLPPDGRIDAGEIVAQHLYLALDPFPRAPGAAWTDRIEDDGRTERPGEDADPGDAPTERRRSPFAILGRRQDKPSGEA